MRSGLAYLWGLRRIKTGEVRQTFIGIWRGRIKTGLIKRRPRHVMKQVQIIAFFISACRAPEVFRGQPVLKRLKIKLARLSLCGRKPGKHYVFGREYAR
jgi:hypothetical protein